MLHYANKGQVNGQAIDANADSLSKYSKSVASLVAFPAPQAVGDKASSAASKLKVVPGLLETAYKSGVRRIFHNHWVLAAGVFVCV